MSEDKLEVKIRPMNEHDLNFIMSSWLKSYRFGSQFAKRIRDNIYYKYHHKVCARILQRPTTNVLIACDKVDPSVILGYLVREGYEDIDLLHFCYVKNAFRQLGIANQLLQAGEIDLNKSSFSHWTSDVDAIIKRYPDMTYVPYLL